MQSIHKTVLLKETIDGLNLKPGATVIDGTFGGGGHSLEVCKRFPDAQIIALDQDQKVFAETGEKFKSCNIKFVNENFRNIDKVLSEAEVGEIDGVILDLGLSSDQLQSSGRGFSFLRDEPLIMTMKEPARLSHSGGNPSEYLLTAYDVVNTWGEENLADVVYGYGEEKQARRIAKAIVEARKKKEIKTTFDLVKVIEEAIPAKFRKGRIHYATKTFQAIRIAVNDELGALKEGLEKGFEFLKGPARPHDGSRAGGGGRMAVITFHSLEDRIVKQFYKAKEAAGQAQIINKKVILASAEEIKNNPRSRSAKLRILEKIK